MGVCHGGWGAGLLHGGQGCIMYMVWQKVYNSNEGERICFWKQIQESVWVRAFLLMGREERSSSGLGPEDMTADKGAPSPSTTEARTDRLGGGTDLNTGTSLKVFCDGQRAEGLRDVKTYEGVLCRQHDSGKTYFVFLSSEFTCWEEWICTMAPVSVWASLQVGKDPQSPY